MCLMVCSIVPFPEKDLIARVETTVSKADFQLLSFVSQCLRAREIGHLTNGAHDPPTGLENEFGAVQQHFSLFFF